MNRLIGMTVACLALALVPARADAAKWMRLRSPHFTVVGDVGVRELTQVAREVEGFRSVFGAALPNATVATPVPTTIIVFGSDAAFTPFKPLVNGKPMEFLGGYFQAGEDANYIAVKLAGGEGDYSLIFHEYSHALISASVRDMPVWLNEGLSEVYSTFAERDGGRSALIGVPPEAHRLEIQRGGLLPLDRLMAVDHDSPIYNEGSRRGMFYAESWVLAHYLLFGNPARHAQLPTYLGLVERGVAVGEAFRQAFECEPRVLEAELRAYVNQFSFNGVKVSFTESFKLTGTLAAEAISQAEADMYTVELLARQQRSEEARARIEAVLKAQPDMPRALAALGRFHLRLNQVDQALPLLERAAAALPDDPAIAATWSRALVEQLRAEGSAAQGDRDAIARSRAALVKAAALEPEDAYVSAMLGYVELLDGARLDDARRLLQRAVAQAPMREEYRLLLAQALIELQSLPEARAMLGPLMARGSTPGIRSAARRLIARTARDSERATADASGAPADAGAGGAAVIEADLAAADPAVPPPLSDDEIRALAEKTAVPPGTVAANSAPVVTSSGARVQLLLRAVGRGERRVVGEFERVDCPQGAIVIHVRVADRTLRLRARGFDAVEFINYRESTVPPPRCGPFAEGLHALATFRPATGGDDAADGEAVAVEIVPPGYVPR